MQHLILPSHRKLHYINRYRKCLVYEMCIAVYACHAYAYHIMSYNNNIQMDGGGHMRCCATFDARTSEIACHQMKPKARVNVTYDTKFTLQKESKVPCKSRGVLHKACWSNVIIRYMTLPDWHSKLFNDFFTST